jgi:Uma2 family endonuclease
MASLVQTPLRDNPAYRQVTVEEFLELELEQRAELIDGMIYMMAGGSRNHAAVSRNILVALSVKLRGSACQPFGPDFGVRTSPATVRLPDASVYCGLATAEEDLKAKLAGDPKLVVEVLSPSTRREDERVKLPEYQALAGVELILLVDPDADRVRLVERKGPESWSDDWLPKGAAVPLKALGISLTADEIFARD